LCEAKPSSLHLSRRRETAHLSLQRVSFIHLACEADLLPFYERWGFKTYDAVPSGCSKSSAKNGPMSE
jgi:hypothetical protein